MTTRELRRAFFRTPCAVTIDGTKYQIEQKIDNGSFGQVFCGHRLNRPNEPVALKIMSHERLKKKHQQKRIRSEIDLHSKIITNNIEWIYENQSGIVKLYTHDHNVKIKHKLYVCMVMEYCAGSHLNQYLRSYPSDRLTEIEAFYFFEQIIRCVECLHNQLIIHRDIKPQNLLLTNTDHSLPILKLCDFGLAKKMSISQATAHSLCGTPNYVAPEIANEIGHSYAADIWSSGIVLYAMLNKHHLPPFETGNVEMTMNRVRNEQVQIPEYLSEECQSFLSLLFIKEHSKRISLSELKNHKWYKANKKKLECLLDDGLHAMNISNLKQCKKRFLRSNCVYDLNNKSAKLCWGGQHADDYSMEVFGDGRIEIVFGGICSKQYKLQTLPIGFYEKYIMLEEFVSCQARQTPLIAISVVADECDTFNLNQYAVLTQSGIVDYFHFDGRKRIYMKYDPLNDEYDGSYYHDFEKERFNVLDPIDNKMPISDINLFDRLKSELLGHLQQKYIDDEEDKENISHDLHHPVIFQYIKEERRTSNSQCLVFDIESL